MGRGVGRAGEGSKKCTTLRSSVAVTEIMESAEELPRQNLNALANLHGPHLLEKSVSGGDGHDYWKRVLRFRDEMYQSTVTRRTMPFILGVSPIRTRIGAKNNNWSPIRCAAHMRCPNHHISISTFPSTISESRTHWQYRYQAEIFSNPRVE